MALTINGTSIPSSGKVVCNGTSLKQLNIGGTKVWNSGIDLIAANNWTCTHYWQGWFSSNNNQLKLYMQADNTGSSNWVIVRSAALDLSGYSQITLTWDNGTAGINWMGFCGFSTNAKLQFNNWAGTNFAPEILITRDQGASGTKTFSIPSQFRRSGVYFYAERHLYATAIRFDNFILTKIQIS